MFYLLIRVSSLQIISLHRRWEVYRGDSKESKDLLFTVKKSSLLQFKTELDVFLASNTSESNCDFKVKGSWLERSCSIYAGNTSTVIAQVFLFHWQHFSIIDHYFNYVRHMLIDLQSTCWLAHNLVKLFLIDIGKREEMCIITCQLCWFILIY